MRRQEDGYGFLKFKGTVSRDFLLRVCHESSPPRPQKITVGSCDIFSKIRGDICKLILPPVLLVSLIPVANLLITVVNFAPCTAGVVDTSGKFADTGGKFATSVNDTGGKGKGISTTPAVN